MNLPRVLRRFKDALLFELQCKSEGHRYIGCDLGECTVPRPDGRPFGRNRYLITNRCTTEWRRAAKVRFSVRMRAWLPGGASFQSEEETIDVSCRPSHVGLYVAVGGSATGFIVENDGSGWSFSEPDPPSPGLSGSITSSSTPTPTPS